MVYLKSDTILLKREVKGRKDTSIKNMGILQEKVLKYIAEEAPTSINKIAKEVSGRNSYKNVYDIYQKFSSQGYIRLFGKKIWLSDLGITPAIMLEADLSKIRQIANENLQGDELTAVLMQCDWRVDMGPDVFRASASYINGGELNLNEFVNTLQSFEGGVKTYTNRYPVLKKQLKTLFSLLAEEIGAEDDNDMVKKRKK